MYDKVITPGAVLRSKWGRDGRDADFFQVLRRSHTHVIIREIDSKYDAGAGEAVPCPDSFIAGAMRRKIRHYHGEEFVLIDGNDRAMLWQPRHAPRGLRFVTM